MSPLETVILEIRGNPPEILLESNGGTPAHAGQYLLAASNDPGEVIPTPLFPASLPGREMRYASPARADWYPGQRIHLRGPLGNGFASPNGFHRLALAALDCAPAPLYPLAAQALAQGAAVTFLSSEPAGLPADVEILPIDSLRDALGWADALYAAFPLSSLARFRRLAGLAVHQPFALFAQVLLMAPMPCSGMGDCGVCGVPTRQGWKQACGDGPVFDLNLLEQP